MEVESKFLEILSSDMIKPSSPTPDHHKHFKFSLIDQLTPHIYVNAVFFYPTATPSGADTHIMSSTLKSLQLKKSLSKTLTQFYPFAGRINSSNDSIDCNDYGVPFVDAFAHCSLLDILEKQHDPAKMKEFVPSMNMKFKDLCHSCPLIVQATSFRCGGMAICISASHKIADAATYITFVTSWALCVDNHPYLSTPPLVFQDFSIAVKLFPPLLPPPEVLFPSTEFESEDCVTKRFIFDGSKITQLINKAKSVDITQPTRVEVVSALIWKCAIRASGFEKKESVLIQSVDMRKRLVPPLHHQAVGNFVGCFEARRDQDNVDLDGLVTLLRKGLIECVKTLREKEVVLTILKAKESVEKMIQDGIKFYPFSSWCKFPFYEVDFGWGKPSWVCPIMNSIMTNSILLMDMKDGKGIEAWVTLKKKDMAEFENDQELLIFTKAQG